jgi:hypothetical protein
MDNYIPPSDYFTFDAISADPLEIVEAILASKSGDHSEIRLISNGVPEFDRLVEGQPAPMDMATMLFLACIDWDLFRDSSKSLDGGRGSREKLGRWPTEDGNAIAYLIEYIDSPNGTIEDLLAKLTLGFLPEFLGESGFDKGAHGLHLMGWVTHSEIRELRREIRRGGWSVKADELFDGGVQDGIRHLDNLLRGAEKYGVGLLMRRHS